MAKRKSSVVQNTVYVIPEASRPFIKLDPDGVHIIRTVRIPRYEDVLIRKSVTRRVDHAQVTPEQFKVTYGYGTGRRCRDGAETKDAKGKTLDAKTEPGRKALLDNAVAHCDVRLEVMYGTRVGKASSSGVSTVTRECRKLLVKYTLKNLTDPKVKRWNPKSVPSALVSAKTLDGAKAEAKRLGVPKKKLDSLCKRGESIAALLDDDTDMSI
jgi:hypothetical protein